MIELDQVRDAIAAVAAGKAVVVVDDERDKGDLVFAAECADPTLMAFMVRHTSGFVCVALDAADCERLDLPSMYHHGDRYRVTVDLRDTGTGISAAARARTAAALADATSSSEDFSRPGHVVPLRASPRGVMDRADQPEAAVDLAQLAGLRPAAVMCTIVSETHPGELARREELASFAELHKLATVSIADLVTYRRRTEPLVIRIALSKLSTTHGELSVGRFTGILDGTEHLALFAGAPGPAVPVYVQNECLSGNVVGPIACTCAASFHECLASFAEAGCGIAVYTRLTGHRLHCDGFTESDRTKAHEVAAAILSDLGATSLRLLNDDAGLREVLYSRGLRLVGHEGLRQHTPVSVVAQ
ncbi:3,4-dihydroxy-2-butanone-4-phosphate synthase [Amycolatopsis sp. TRM77291]